MTTLTIEDKFNLKELELKALLEITEAINSNLSEASLYKIYEFTLRANLDIKKLALFVFGDKWELKVSFGAGKMPEIDLESLGAYKNITNLTDHEDKEVARIFDWFIPVRHKDRMLAFLLIDQESIDMNALNANFIQALTNIIVVAIENKKLARRQIQEEAFRREMEIAKRVQALLFPTNLPWNPELKVQATYLPHHEVGGDYYDYIEISPHEFIFCVADVSGKGVPAALLMSNFQAALQTLSRKVDNLVDIIEELNLLILKNSNGENFITVFLGKYNSETCRLQYVSAGHNPILLKNADEIHQLESSTTVLGAFEDLPFVGLRTIENIRKFVLMVYTDGIVEMMNEAGEQFGFERLMKIVQDHNERQMHQEVISQIMEWQGQADQHDDLTLLTFLAEFPEC